MALLNALPSALAQGLIWGIMAIGVYITYKILNLSDLTVDGSFATGGAVFVVLMIAGWNVWAAMAAAVIAGMLAGLVTGFFHTVCGIPAILAGILTQLGLWSVNLAVMGWSSNKAMNLNKVELLISMRHAQEVEAGVLPFYRYPIVVVCIATAVIIGLLYWFFGTERGASIRATGANENMARSQGINTNVNKVMGLMIGNGLVALSGCLWTQYFGFAEINMGRGAIVIGLAAIIIGDVTFGKIFNNFALKLLAVSLGSVIYYVVIQIVVSAMDINTNLLKLISALIVALFLAVPNLRQKVFKKHGKERKHANH
jgi:putative ABC transport system permease protein